MICRLSVFPPRCALRSGISSTVRPTSGTTSCLCVGRRWSSVLSPIIMQSLKPMRFFPHRRIDRPIRVTVEWTRSAMRSRVCVFRDAVIIIYGQLDTGAEERRRRHLHWEWFLQSKLWDGRVAIHQPIKFCLWVTCFTCLLIYETTDNSEPTAQWRHVWISTWSWNYTQ